MPLTEKLGADDLAKTADKSMISPIRVQRNAAERSEGEVQNEERAFAERMSSTVHEDCPSRMQ